MDTPAPIDQDAAHALTGCLHLGRHERLLVVCDPPCAEVGEAFFRAGTALCRETVLVRISPRDQNGNEPPDPVGEWFGQFDVAVMPTSRSLSHTRARRNASARGTRIATLPGITTDIFSRTMKADWERIGARTRTIATQLTGATRIRVQTDAGTDLTFETGGRHAKPDDGRLQAKGAFGNLPPGEAYLAPLEGTAQGTLVIDGSFPLAGLLDTPLILEVRKGKVHSATGHPCARELEKLFVRYHRASRTIAEFGVGTLDTATLSGNTLEDEKVAGTVHFAVGDNASMGGTIHVPIHLDGVVRQPRVWLDGRLWMEKGVPVSGG